jgi:uncharacterized protein YcaQ
VTPATPRVQRTPPTPGSVRRLGRTEARRIAVRAQLLEATRPPSLLTVAERLTFLQLDPTSVIAPSADLVAWSRLGSGYAAADLTCALEQDRTMFEQRAQPNPFEPYLAMARPMADLPLFLAEMSAWWDIGQVRRGWMAANDAFRRRVLDQLRDSGPLSSREIPDTSQVAWQSSGWTNDRNVTQMLEFLGSGGSIAVSGRRGRERLWDLAERVYPSTVRPVPLEEARRIREQRWLRALGIARPKFVGDAGIPIEIEGTKGEWRLDPAATAEGFKGRTAILSPFDRLSHDRSRAIDLFEFEYILEMYKPAPKRRWGYFALPILHDDRLVGKVDAAADRKASVLRVAAIHEDEPFTAKTRDAVRAELDALRGWLGLETIAIA